MGSKGMGSLAHMASFTKSFSSLVNASLGLEMVFDDSKNSFAKLILFSVMVPVLSVQITVALPNVSTVFICFTTMPIFISRQAPSAINVVNATGISSGKMLMARVSDCNRLFSKCRSCQ